MPGYSDKDRAATASYGSVATQKGDKAGQAFDSSEDVATKADTDEFDKSFGATGIAGASKRATPAYKSGLAAHLAKKKAMRASGAKAQPLIKTGM